MLHTHTHTHINTQSSSSPVLLACFSSCTKWRIWQETLQSLQATLYITFLVISKTRFFPVNRGEHVIQYTSRVICLQRTLQVTCYILFAGPQNKLDVLINNADIQIIFCRWFFFRVWGDEVSDRDGGGNANPGLAGLWVLWTPTPGLVAAARSVTVHGDASVNTAASQPLITADSCTLELGSKFCLRHPRPHSIAGGHLLSTTTTTVNCIISMALLYVTKLLHGWVIHSHLISFCEIQLRYKLRPLSSTCISSVPVYAACCLLSIMVSVLFQYILHLVVCP